MSTRQLLLSVGKRHDVSLVTAIDEFSDRLNREIDTEWQFIKPSGADELSARRLESAAILAILRSDDFVVLLDERGQQFSSVELAAAYEGWLMRPGRVVFVIGGAYGVDEILTARADVIWALGKLIFPHQLVRVILAEQLYRARMISRNHPYHHT